MYSWKSEERTTGIVGIISLLFIVVSRLWKLDKGLIFSDEGWYVTLLRDNPSASTSRFYKLFQFGIQNDIYSLRLLFCLLLLFAIFLFAFSVYKLQDSFKLKHSFFSCLSFVCLGSLQAHSISTPNYITLNLFFGLLAMSFCLLYLSSKKWYYIVLSSCFGSFLFMTQVLGIVLIPAIYLVSLFFSDRKWSLTMQFAAGLLIFLCLFFCIESPKELIDSLVNQTQKVASRGSSDYGIIFLIKWSVTSFSYIFKFLLAAFVFYQGYLLAKSHDCLSKHKVVICVILFMCIFGYVNVFVIPHCHPGSIKKFNQLGFSFFLAFLFIIMNIKNLTRANVSVCILLLFVPFALCLGTNTEFLARYSTFLVFLLPVIFVFSDPNRKMKLIALAYFSITLIVSVLEINKANWLGEKPSDQTVSVKTIGIDQNLYLTDNNIQQLVFCQKYIKDGTWCLCSTETWGIVALLNLRPLSYSWKLPKPDILSTMIYDKLIDNDVVIISSVTEELNENDLQFPENIFHQKIVQHDISLDYYSLNHLSF